MSKPDRELRIERQQYDDGDADDVVTVSRSYYGAAYHDDADCEYLPDDADRVREITRGDAQARWMQPCLFCVVATGADITKDRLKWPDTESEARTERWPV